MLTPEKEKQIKEQIINQINSTFPEEQKSSAVSQIQEMSSNELVQFLIQNKLIKNEGDLDNLNQQTQCIFCSIISGQIPSTKVGENQEAIATLEINPIAQGHTIIIPKQHIEQEKQIPQKAFELAEEVSQKIKQKLNPKEVQKIHSQVLNHWIINLLPIYSNETIDSERYKATPEELSSTQKIILQETQIEKEKTMQEKEEEIKKEISEKTHWLPKRIP